MAFIRGRISSSKPSMEEYIFFNRVFTVQQWRTDISYKQRSAHRHYGSTCGYPRRPAALVHFDSLTLALNVMKTVRYDEKETTIADMWRSSRPNLHIPLPRCVFSGQSRHVVMLSDKEVRPPSRNSDTA
jgi:hypothetical protein